MRSSNKIQRAFHSCWQRTTVHLRNEIWVLTNALYGKRMNWYVHWCVLQKAHSVNKVATVSGPFCCLPGAGLPWQPQGHGPPFFTELLGILPYLPPLRTIQITSKTATPRSLIPPPLLLLFGSGGLNSWAQASATTIRCLYWPCTAPNRPTALDWWVGPSHPTKPFNLWMSTGNLSLWMKRINYRLTDLQNHMGLRKLPISYPTCCLSTATRAKANF